MKRKFERWIATSTLLLAGACSSNGGMTATTAGNTSVTPMAGSKPPSAAGTNAGGVAGTTGMTAGGAAGMPPTGGGMKCGAPSTMPGPMLHAAALAAIVATSQSKLPCAFSSCHDMTQKKAGLNLDVGTVDLKATLVGKPSCEVPTINLVDATGGDAGLAKSWLWLKLTAAVDASANLTSDPTWGAGNLPCGQDPGAPFGVRMPKAGGTEGLSDTRLNPVRDWICAGAPGPM